MTRPPLPRYFVASVLVLASLTAVLAVSSARRTRGALSQELEAKGHALAETVEIASRSAIRGNALMEEMIAQRLLDNARLVDRLLFAQPLSASALDGIREANRLRRVDLLDREGRPWTPPAPPAGHRMTMAGPMRGMMGPRAGHGPPGAEEGAPHPPPEMMMRFFWGRRWGTPPEDPAAAGPPPIRDRRFWEGTLFGVAVGARSFPGIIAVHADAAYVLDFRKEIGVERQLEELGRQPGVQAVALLSPALEVLAHSDPARVGATAGDALLREAAATRRSVARIVPGPAGDESLAIVRPLALAAGRLGFLRVDLSTGPVREAWRRDLRAAALLGTSVLLLGGLGLGAVFYLQGRHLREVRALEVEVERRERLAGLGNLAAAVGHEVRNPLNAISMGLQRLRAEFEPAAGAAEYARMVELVQGEVRRLDGIVDEFLSLARPVPLRPVPTRPADLLGEVVALVGAEARSRGVAVDLRASGELPPARLDPDRVRQVLLNLVRNGLDAMPRGGRLTVGAEAAGDLLLVRVEDTGEGIPEDLLPRVFEPYVTTKATGVGLGLAIARRIVEAHGGRVLVESRPGEGSRFTVALPLAGPAEPGAALG